MAFPIVAGESTFLDTANNTNHAVPYPTTATIVSGDLLLVIFAIDSGGSTVSNWGGFSQLDYSDVATATASGGVAYRIADGTETGSFTIVSTANERASARCFHVQNWHGTTPPEISTVVTGNSTNPDPGALTPSWGADDTLWFAVSVIDQATSMPTATAAPASYTNFETVTGTSAGQTNTAQRQLNAASENPGAFTAATEQWAAWTIAIRPAAAGGAANVPLGTAAATAAATLAVTAPTRVALGTAAASSVATLTLSAQTRVPLATAAAQSSATLALTAPAILPLGASAAQSAATLALTVPAGATVVPLNPAAGASAATLAVTAKTTVALSAAAATSTANLALKAPTQVPLGAAAAQSSATLAVTASTQVQLSASSATSNATLAVTIPSTVQFGRPVADIAAAGWVVAPLWSKLDESAPNDADLVTGVAV